MERKAFKDSQSTEQYSTQIIPTNKSNNTILPKVHTRGGHNATTATAASFKDEDLDVETLHQLESEISLIALKRLINLFIEETKTRLNNITCAQAEGDWQRLRREAHTLKSAAGAFGAKRLQEHAQRLDQCCMNGDSDKIQGLTKSIGSVATPALEALAREYPFSQS